ncbi:MAG TPA: dolichyl-phosphate beta-glucosyltransferase [Candidatus Saccharimonadales bacterium]|nr:dolichyl-phosphate beta-glucosyltransferase [Candidatus Saccharimonadales bacterium]
MKLAARWTPRGDDLRVLSVIVPAYNEEQRLPATLVRMREYLDGREEPYELFVVDDGSSDSTLTTARTIAGDWPQMHVLTLAENTGKGAAVRLGMLAANGEHRIFSDADLSTPIEEMERLRERLHGQCAVAIASRALPGSQIDVHQPGRREVMGRTYNRMLQVAALKGLHDTQCGFKAFTAEAAIACFEPLRTLRFGFDAEVLLRARRLGWTVAEVPVRWEHKEDSRVSAVRDSVGTLYDLLRLRFIVRR